MFKKKKKNKYGMSVEKEETYINGILKETSIWILKNDHPMMTVKSIDELKALRDEIDRILEIENNRF